MPDFSTPFNHFTQWFEEAKKQPTIKDPNAVNVATVSPEGKPASRMVLLKDYDENGFVFYTNLGSRKAQHLHNNPHAAMCFYWEILRKQIRIEGSISPVSEEEADAYFHSRALKSRIGAWASKQSQPLDSRATLLKEVAKQTARFALQDVPRPEFWSGFRLTPDYFEFWQNGEYRIHDRTCYQKNTDGTWGNHLLYP